MQKPLDESSGAYTLLHENLISNGSLESGQDSPDSWKCITAGSGEGAWIPEPGRPENHVFSMKINGPSDLVRWQYEDLHLDPETHYTVRIVSRAVGSENTDADLRLIYERGMRPFFVDLETGPEWNVTQADFVSSGKKTGPFYVQLSSASGSTYEVLIDDVVLYETPYRPTRTELALLTDKPEDAVVDVFEKLYPDRMQVFALSEPVQWGRINRFEKMLIFARDAAHLQNIDWNYVEAFVGAGKTAVLDLEAYAAMTGSLCRTKTLPVRRPMKLYRSLPEEEQTRERRQEALDAARAVPTPRVEVVREDIMSSGYPVGSLIPWFGTQEDEFVQRRIVLPAERKTAEVIARSNLDNGAVWLRQSMGRGTVYALDIISLNEPTLTWKDRGSYNKYSIIQNALGYGLRFGRYWNYKPTYQEYKKELEKLAEKYPALELTNEGYLHGYNRIGLCIGNPKGPIYVYSGMAHAAGEYRSGLYGLYAFAEYLGRNADQEPLKSRLEEIGIKIIPVVAPELYIAGSFDRFPQFKGSEEKLPPTYWAGKKDNVVAAIQQHHGIGPLYIAFGWSMGHGADWSKAIYDRAMNRFYETAPSAYWHSEGGRGDGPWPVNSRCLVCPNHYTWDTYFDNPVHYAGIPTINPDILRDAKLNVLMEHTIFGLGPEERWGGAELEYSSAIMTDQSCAFLVASIFVDPVPDAVPERPES